jgi:hypothetical protein
MVHTPGFHRRLSSLMLQSDLVRGAISLLLLVVLLVARLPWWNVVILSGLAYFGLWLSTSSIARTSESKRNRSVPKTDNAAYSTCLELLQEIQVLTGGIEDPQVSNQFRSISVQIERILEAISEDGKFQASVPLFGLVGLTADLLTGYLKIVQRGLERVEMQDQIRANLESLDTAYERFWEWLNRDVVVNITALTEIIDFTLTELPRSSRIGGIT